MLHGVTQSTHRDQRVPRSGYIIVDITPPNQGHLPRSGYDIVEITPLMRDLPRSGYAIVETVTPTGPLPRSGYIIQTFRFNL